MDDEALKRLTAALMEEAVRDAKALGEGRPLMGEYKPRQKKGLVHRRRRRGEALDWTLEPMFARGCEVLGVEETRLRAKIWGLILDEGDQKFGGLE